MRPSTRLLAALTVATLTPAVAWVLWISWSDGGSGDAQHVAWFVTVAAGAVASGWVMPRRVLAGAVVSLVAVLATMTALYRWWEAEDSSGLFLVGIFLAAPLVTAAGPALVAIGSGLQDLSRGRRRGAAAAPGRRPRGA